MFLMILPENLLLRRLSFGDGVVVFYFQKQPLEVLFKKSCSKNFRNIHRKTTVLESLSNFIKKRLQHRCFSVNFAKFLRTPILKNIWEQLLLNLSFLRFSLGVGVLTCATWNASLQKTLSKSTINVLLSCPWILFLCCCWWLGKTLRIVFTHNPRTLSIQQEQVKYMRHILYMYICIYIYIYTYI